MARKNQYTHDAAGHGRHDDVTWFYLAAWRDRIERSPDKHESHDADESDDRDEAIQTHWGSADLKSTTRMPRQK